MLLLYGALPDNSSPFFGYFRPGFTAPVCRAFPRALRSGMRFSRNLLAVVVFAAWTLSCSSCKNGATPFKWPDFLTCGPDVGAFVGSVTQILLNDTSSDTSPSVQQQLTQLAEQYGAAAVLCTVNVLARDWSAPGASASPQRIAGAARARAFLASTGTKIGDLLDQPSD